MEFIGNAGNPTIFQSPDLGEFYFLQFDNGVDVIGEYFDVTNAQGMIFKSDSNSVQLDNGSFNNINGIAHVFVQIGKKHNRKKNRE